MRLYEFDRNGVRELVFAEDRENLYDVLGDNCGTTAEVAADFGMNLRKYHDAWRELPPDERVSLPGFDDVETRTVAEWIARHGDDRGSGLFYSTEV